MLKYLKIGNFRFTFFGDITSVLLPAINAVAGDAMLYVISYEMISELHSLGFENPVTYALVACIMCIQYIQKLI